MHLSLLFSETFVIQSMIQLLRSSTSFLRYTPNKVVLAYIKNYTTKHQNMRDLLEL